VKYINKVKFQLNVKKIIHILYKIYIFKTWATLKLQKNQSQKSERVEVKILG